MPTENEPTRQQLEQAIAAQDRLRSSLGDVIVDTTIAALRSELDRIEAFSRSGPRRRVATVFFMDVVDSTGSLRTRDPEETMAMMDSALERLARPIEGHGGRVTRFMGDGYLAVFGLPMSRENDPEMAVRAGLAVQDEAVAVGRDLRKRHGLEEFSVRIGINTGLVASGGKTEAEDTIMGVEVNLAARLESAAPPGGILISHGTLQHVRDRFRAEARGEIDAKGFPSPIPVYLVLGIAEESQRGANNIIEGITTPMVGREAELSVLRDALFGARGSGAMRVIAVSGPPGTGKSRLAREFENTLNTTTRCFRARASPEDREVPYALIRDLLARCFELRITDGSEDVRRKLIDGMVPEMGDEAEETADLLSRLTGFDLTDPADHPQQLRDTALTRLAEYLQPSGAHTTTVLTVEDLQWADEASLEGLSQLAVHLDSHPVLMVVAARPEFWAPGRVPGLDRHRIELGPLDDEATRRLVDSIVDSVEGDTFALRRLLVTRSEGNPHFIEEIVRMVADDGILVRSGSAWVIETTRLQDLRVPPTLTGVVQARLDALDEEERSLLQRASVVGRVFWTAAVASLVEGTDVPERLESLERRDMVVAHETSAFPDTTEYAFRHTVLRDVAYESVLLEARARLHGLAADWLLEHTRQRSGEVLGLIATHLEKAGRDAEALEYLTKAGEAARSGYAVGAAADFLDRALALVPPEDLAHRFDLLFARQEISRLQGDRERQEQILDELDDVAGHLGDPGKQALAAVERTWLHFYRSEFPTMLAAADSAADLASAGGDRLLESRARSARAWAHLSLEVLDLAADDARVALSLAEEGGSRQYEAAARNALGMISLMQGDPSQASVHLGRALVLAGARDDPAAESTYLNNLAVARMLVGDFISARGHFDRLFELAEAAGDESLVASAYTNLAWVASSLAEWETASEMAERGLSMMRRQGHREGEAETLLWLGHALTGLGRTDEALGAYRQSLVIREDLEQTALAFGVLAGMARAHLVAGHSERALEYADRIVEYLDGDGSLVGTWEPLRIHLTCVEVLEAIGDDRSDRVLARARATLEERAAKITDAADRRMLIEAVPWHREIRERASRIGGSGDAPPGA